VSKPNICFQGEYDGACFLYSITNAFKALTGKKPTQELWDEALKLVPFGQDFLVNIGTTRYDDDMDLYVLTVKRMLQIFSKNKFSFEVKAHPKINSQKKLHSLICDNCVIILVTEDHWMVGVDIDDREIYLADSYKLVTMGAKYQEKQSHKLQRSYNDSRALKDLSWLYNPSVVQILVK